jgi:hypothetical protein
MPATAPTTLDEMVALALQVRAEQDQRPKSERIHIGGELILTVLNEGVISSLPVFRWDDYDDMWNAMKALASNPEIPA